jgi:hypothetical protein
MKKLIITCALLSVGSVVSFAQSTTTTTTNMDPNGGQNAAQQRPAAMNPEQMADRRTKMDEKMLALTPDQIKPVHDVELDFMTAMSKFRTEGKQPTPDQMQSILDKRDQKMKTILTADQYSKYSVSRGGQHNAPMPPANQPQPAGQQTGK